MANDTDQTEDQLIEAIFVLKTQRDALALSLREVMKFVPAKGEPFMAKYGAIKQARRILESIEDS